MGDYAFNNSLLVGYNSTTFATTPLGAGNLFVSNRIAIGKTGSTAAFDVNGSAIITGSLIVLSGITGSLSGSITGSLFGTASQATSASYAFTASSATNSSASLIAVSASYSFTASSATSASLAQTASFALRGSGSFTGSLFGTASQALTASYALGGDASAILYQTASAAFTWSFNHFLQTQYPVFTIYDNTNSVIIPQRIQAVDTSSALIYFSTPTTGVAVASKGGYSSSVVTSAVIANTAISASFASSGTGTFSGSFSGSYQGNFSGSLIGTASQAASASFAFTASSAISSSLSQTASFASTASNVLGGITSYVPLWNSATTLGSSVIFQSSSNIGISTSPQSGFKLDVGGWTVLRGEVYSSGNIIGFGSNTNYQIGETGTTWLAAATGNVGIGHRSPLFKLDVSGSSRFTDSMIVTGSLTVTTGSAIEFQVTNTGTKIGNLITDSHNVTGSLAVLGSITGSLSGSVTGSLFGTSSQAVSSSYALTASFALNAGSSFPFTGSAQITGSLGVTGSFSVSAGAGSSVFSSNADTLLITGSLIITGSGASITGSLNVSNGITGSLFGTASQATSASYAFTASSASTAFSASFAATSSFANNFTVANQLTAQTLVVTTVSSSVVFSSGSNIFGNSTANTQTFTGSVNISGSLTLVGRGTINDLTGSLFGTASQAQTASFVLNAVSSSYAFTASSAISSSYAFTASSATNATNALSASNFTITSTLNFDGTLTDYNTVAASISGTNNVFAQVTGSYRSGFFKYTAINGTNARTGEVMAAWNGANIVFTDFATTDIGATNDVTMSAALAGGTVQFNAITQGSGWNIRSIGTYM